MNEVINMVHIANNHGKATLGPTVDAFEQTSKKSKAKRQKKKRKAKMQKGHDKGKKSKVIMSVTPIVSLCQGVSPKFKKAVRV